MNTLTSLLAFSAWFLALGFVMFFMRVSYAMRGKHPGSFDPDGKDLGGGFGWRLTRARNNCYENLPLFGAIVLVAAVTNRLEVTDGLAMYVFIARVVQSVFHLMSTRAWSVYVRLTATWVQWVIYAYWIIQLLR